MAVPLKASVARAIATTAKLPAPEPDSVPVKVNVVRAPGANVTAAGAAAQVTPVGPLASTVREGSTAFAAVPPELRTVTATETPWPREIFAGAVTVSTTNAEGVTTCTAEDWVGLARSMA